MDRGADLCAFKLGMEIFGHLRHLTRGSVSQTGQPGVIGLRHDDLGAAFGAEVWDRDMMIIRNIKRERCLDRSQSTEMDD